MIVESVAAAMALLTSRSIASRLEAARYLKNHAGPAEAERLRAASEFETDPLVSTALRQALARSDANSSRKPARDDGNGSQLADARRAAIRDTTRMMLHELRPLVGQLEVTAQQHVDDPIGSGIPADLDRIRETLNAFEDLYSATDSPLSEEFDLTDLVMEVARSETARFDGAELIAPADESVYVDGGRWHEDSPAVELFLAGDEPVTTVGAPRLIKLILGNALRNAIEASLDNSDGTKRVVVSWGATDVDGWVTVVDDGAGLPPELPEPFAAGATAKSESEHRGMGLVVVAEAASSIDARVTLENRTNGGCRFQARWPLEANDS